MEVFFKYDFELIFFQACVKKGKIGYKNCLRFFYFVWYHIILKLILSLIHNVASDNTYYTDDLIATLY